MVKNEQNNTERTSEKNNHIKIQKQKVEGKEELVVNHLIKYLEWTDEFKMTVILQMFDISYKTLERYLKNSELEIVNNMIKYKPGAVKREITENFYFNARGIKFRFCSYLLIKKYSKQQILSEFFITEAQLRNMQMEIFGVTSVKKKYVIHSNEYYMVLIKWMLMYAFLGKEDAYIEYLETITKNEIAKVSSQEVIQTLKAADLHSQEHYSIIYFVLLVLKNAQHNNINLKQLYAEFKTVNYYPVRGVYEEYNKVFFFDYYLKNKLATIYEITKIDELMLEKEMLNLEFCSDFLLVEEQMPLEINVDDCLELNGYYYKLYLRNVNNFSVKKYSTSDRKRFVDNYPIVFLVECDLNNITQVCKAFEIIRGVNNKPRVDTDTKEVFLACSIENALIDLYLFYQCFPNANVIVKNLYEHDPNNQCEQQYFNVYIEGFDFYPLGKKTLNGGLEFTKMQMGTKS